MIFHSYVSLPEGTRIVDGLKPYEIHAGQNTLSEMVMFASMTLSVEDSDINRYLKQIPFGYDIHSLPWKITMLLIGLIGKPSISIRAIEKPWLC